MSSGLRRSAAVLAAVAAVWWGHPAAAAGPGEPPEPPAMGSPEERVRPDESGTAQATGRRVEVIGERTETGRLFANPDGTFTREQHASPIQVRTAAGWVPIDTTLVARPDGTVAPRAAAVDLAFSGGGSTVPLARIGRDGGSLALGWPRPLPAPVLDGSTAVYPEVLPGVDLKVTANATGFSEVLVVKTRAAAAQEALRRITLTTSAQGLSVSTDAAGNVDARDAGGEVVVHAPAPEMWDSSQATGEPADLRALAAGTAVGGRRQVMRVEKTDGGLVLVPDQAMLKDPATRFPVHIDPSYGAARTAWTYVSKHFSGQSYWNSSESAPSGYYNDPSSFPTVDTKRSFFRMDTDNVNGKHIIKATFRTWENHSWSCDGRTVDLWLTGAIDSGTKWSDQPTWHRRLDSKDVAKGYSSSCPDGGVDFDATSAVVEAAGKDWGNLTLGLRARDEGDTKGWKRFKNNPTLEITYNTVPSAPDQIAMVPDVDCATGAARPYIGVTTPTLKARVRDGDNSVRADFEWWALDGTAKIGSSQTSQSTSGLVRQAAIPAGALVDGGTYKWRVRAEDGVDSSGWSPWCEFTVDTTLPHAVPGVGSGDFPEDAWGGRLGEPGTFQLTSGGVDDVAEYVYGVNEDPPSTRLRVAAPGEGAAVRITPTRYGINRFSVRTADRAGNPGPIRTYVFFAHQGTGPSGQWALDEGTGGELADASGNGHPAALSGETAWSDGRKGKAVTFTTGKAATSGPVLSGGKGFTLAAWVLATDKATRAALRQDGVSLGRDAGGKWAFTAGAAVTSAQPALQRAWTHLAGVYDPVTGERRLYVDGVLAGAATAATVPALAGPLEIGPAWAGAVDEAGVWQRVLGQEEIAALAATRPKPSGHWAFDEGTGAVTADLSGNGRPATLRGATAWETSRTPESVTALSLDAAGHAATEGPALRTDQSFTVSAWAKPADSQGAGTVLSQDGARSTGFALRHSATGWAFATTAADADAAAVTKAVSLQKPAAGAWAHVSAVYDAPARQQRLYVDGELAGTATRTTAGWNATGALRIGGELGTGGWKGLIDDARVWQEIVPEHELRALAERGPRQAAHWKLDEGRGGAAGDSSGRGHTATLAGGATWSRGPTGADGTALLLDGEDDRAVTTGPVAQTDRSLTVSAWVRQDDQAGHRTVLCQQANALCGLYLAWSGDDGAMRIMKPASDVTEPASWGEAQAKGAPDLGVWTHFTGVYDHAARQTRIYVNGVLKGSADAPGAWKATGPVSLGRTFKNGTAYSHFLGAIADVRIYQGELSDDEVFQLAHDS
ncbi:LamG domain-containing protein [Nonomuraea sp. NPDC059023]|uniref:LamG domain-containing protein n=1 Tax=unclassified Nonomuraea TaxID=2593643 RepID=UPI0036837844